MSVSRPSHDPDAWLEPFDGVDASGWLSTFRVEPADAIDALLRHRFYLGPLNAVEPAQLLTSWLDLIGTADGFARTVDRHLAAWIDAHWGVVDEPAELVARTWTTALSAVATSAVLGPDSRLIDSARALRLRFSMRERFLGTFSTSTWADPLGLYLAAIAEFQSDRSLATFWLRLCDLPHGVPFYHASYAMLGLRRLPAASEAEQGTLRIEVASGLRRLAIAFDRLVKERVLSEDVAHGTFRRVARTIAVAYPDSPLWREYANHDRLSERAHDWLAEAVPAFQRNARRVEAQRRGTRHRGRALRADPTWGDRGREIAGRLAAGNLDALADARALLRDERRYGEATGDTYSLVRSLCSFATRVVRYRPKLAIAWAREARWSDPTDPWTWNTLRDVLLTSNAIDEALRIGWIACMRFPESSISRNGLANALKAAGRHAEAEEVYRRAIETSPNDAVARNGYADILDRRRSFAEAERVCRETIDLTLASGDRHNHVVARNTLAGVLKARGRYPEAEREYRKIVDEFPKDSYARGGLADTLRRLGRFDEAETVYRETIGSQLAVAATYFSLAHLLLVRRRALDEARDLVRRGLRSAPHDRFGLLLEQALDESASADSDDLATLATRLEEESERSPQEGERIARTHEVDEGARVQAEVAGERPVVTEAARGREDAGDSRGEEGGGRHGDAPSAGRAVASGAIEPEPGSSPGVSDGRAPAREQDEPSALVEDMIDDPSFLVAALVAESRFYRTWASRGTSLESDDRRARAGRLLEEAESLVPNDAQVGAERAALEWERGGSSEAITDVTEKLTRHPGSFPLLALKARLDRRTARREGRPHDAMTLQGLLEAPTRIRQIEPSLASVFHLQRGLAAIALLDGQERLEAAATAFTQFRRIVAARAHEERGGGQAGRDRSAAVSFHSWLSEMTDTRLFPAAADEGVVRPEDIPEIENIVEQPASPFDEIEDAIVDRRTFAGI